MILVVSLELTRGDISYEELISDVFDVRPEVDRLDRRVFRDVCQVIDLQQADLFGRRSLREIQDPANPFVDGEVLARDPVCEFVPAHPARRWLPPLFFLDHLTSLSIDPPDQVGVFSPR